MISDVVIDLSHWQRNVNFPALKMGGVVALILKATQGSNWLDNTFKTGVTQAQDAGLLVGAYHFADGSNPEHQVDWFLKNTDTLDVLAVDIEPNSIGSTVSIEQAAEIVARIAMDSKRNPLVYIGRYGLDGFGTGLPNNVFSNCPLWLPAYNLNPVCPKGWANWTLWQHTDKGLTSGVGLCDQNYFSGDYDQLIKWWGG